MQLLDIDSIRTLLDKEFLPLEPIVTGMRLVPFTNGEASMVACQESLDVKFPTSFSRIVTCFDFGYFTIGPVAFCNRGDFFAWLTDSNNAANRSFFSENGNHPEEVIMIANSDRFALFLNVNSGQVLALEHVGNLSNDAFLVARDFELLLRGLGTAFFQRNPDGNNNELGRQIASLVSGDSVNHFWQWIAA